MLLSVVANDKMVQPLSYSENRTKGTASVVSRHLSRPLGVVWSRTCDFDGTRPPLKACPCPCT